MPNLRIVPSCVLYSHVVPSPASSIQLAITPPSADEVAAAGSAADAPAAGTAAAIRSLRELAPCMQGADLTAALRRACHNSGAKAAFASVSWTVKAMVATLLVEAFNMAFKTEESEGSAAQKNLLADLLAGLIAGSVILGLLHPFLDKRAGAWLNRCGAATITLPPNGKALRVFNLWFSSVFALRSGLIAGLAAAGKMDFFATEGEKNRAANALFVSLISSMLSILCGYIGTYIGSALAVAATPEANRRAMLTVREDPLGPYVENNGTFHPRANSAELRGATEGERFGEVALARAIAGGFSGVSQVLLTELLGQLPFATENGSSGKVLGSAIATAYAVQCAVNGGWRQAGSATLKGVVAAKRHAAGNEEADANTWWQKLFLLPSSESSMESFASHFARAVYTLSRAASCTGSSAVAPSPVDRTSSEESGVGRGSVASQASLRYIRPIPTASGSRPSSLRQLSSRQDSSRPPSIDSARSTGDNLSTTAHRGSSTSSTGDHLSTTAHRGSSGRRSGASTASRISFEPIAPPDLSSMQSTEVLIAVLDELIGRQGSDGANTDDRHIINMLLQALQERLQVQRAPVQNIGESSQDSPVDLDSSVNRLRQLWALHRRSPEALRAALNSQSFNL